MTSFLKNCFRNVLILILIVVPRLMIAKVLKQTINPVKTDILDTRSVQELQNESATTKDMFTQTEAFVSLAQLREAMLKNLKIVPYLDLVSRMIVKEAELKDTHYVFYHGTDNVWRLPQDLFTMLYAYFRTEHPISQDFKFLRFGKGDAGLTPRQFLAEEIGKNGLVDDNGEAKLKILSVNLALFANVGLPGECTWNYFLTPKSHEEPNAWIYELIMNEFGLAHTYIKELMELPKIYETKEQTILQIFVPKAIVDQIAYLAWIKGIPAHEASMEWVRNNLKGKNLREGASEAIAELANRFKEEREQDPIFRDLLENVNNNKFSVSAFLKIYCNKPWECEAINDVSARLIFTPEVLLNPRSDVRIFRYSDTSREDMKIYYKQLKIIIDKIIAEKEGQAFPEKSIFEILKPVK